jgi:RNA polymerase sigma-70 factor (ECF subfamily)
MIEVQDQALVARAVEGDRDALVELLQEHAPQLRRRLAGRIAPHWRAALEIDDVLQVTYLEAFQRIASFEYRGPGSLLAWLTRIALNNLHDALKSLERAKRLPPEKRLAPASEADSSLLLLNVLGANTDTPSRHAAAHEIHAAVLQALDRLPADYAQVLRLYDLQCCVAEQVARQMNRSIGAVYMMRSRALDRLREVLGSASNYFSVP